MPWRAKEAATSSIKSSIGAPRNENNEEAVPVGEQLRPQSLVKSPRGLPGEAGTRGKSPQSIHPLRRDVSREWGGREVTSTLSSPLVFGFSPLFQPNEPESDSKGTLEGVS